MHRLVNHYSKTKFTNSDKNLLQVMARKASKIVHANYDSLTGLANRNGYEHFLESAFSQVKEYDSEKSLLHINIDQLHIINDTVSFAAGDAIIRNVSGVISEEKREYQMRNPDPDHEQKQNHKGTPVKSSSTALTCISLGKQRTQRINF